QLKVRIDGERLAEFLAAGALTPRGAMNERQVLVGTFGFRVIKAQVDRPLQVAGRVGIRPFIVLANAGAKRGSAHAGLHQIMPGLRAARGKQQEDGQRTQVHRKRCLILTASPAFSSTRSTWAGKVELRSSMVCAPGARASVRSGGLRPRLS